MSSVRLSTHRVLVTFALALFVSGAWAYPDKPIRLVVPNPPGGGTDIMARRFAEKLRAALDQPVVIDNRAGAGGAIAAEAVAKAAPDGYTLLLGTGESHGTNSAVFKSLPYDPIKDFAPISLLVGAPKALFVPAGSPVRNAAELVALAKKQPGRLNYGSYGVGTVTHLLTELFKVQAGIELTHIPYKGSVAAQLGLIANDVQMIFDGVSSASAHVASGKIRIIGIASANRLPVSPNTPTLTESGVPFAFDSGFMALFAPAGTPREVVMTLNREIVNAARQADLRDWLIGQAYEVVASSPEYLADRVSSQIDFWRKFVRERNLKFDN